MALTVLDKLKSNEKCVFCRHNEINELLYGKMYKFENVITHYFCMLFSSNMEQNGDDDQGILGFLPRDIRKEVSRGNKLTCSYCQHPGATIGCSVRSCKKKFHYPCGVHNGSLHLFYGQFRSYCYAHRPSQTVPQSAIKLVGTSICVMCQDQVTPKPILSTVWSPCCKTTWLHRECVQRMAVNAGYFFKCPACNNKDLFRKEMLECGIYIPDQDAAWELEPNAYYELTERYNSCDAPNCVCPNGRNFSEAGLEYEITLCSLCGSQGIHNKCGEDFFDNMGQWTCESCVSITKNTTPVVATSTADPGPSTISQKRTNPARPSQNLRKERSHATSSRKRSLSSDSDEENSACKIPSLESQSPIADANETIRLLDSSGETIEVVRLESTSDPGVEIGGVKVAHPANNTKTVSDIVQIDSDDEEDDSTTNTVTEKQTTIADRNSIKPKVTPDTAPSIFIDLLDDSDEEETPQLTHTTNANDSVEPPVNVQNCRVNDDDEDDDDDVIFVSHEAPESTPAKEDNSTAIIRIVENDRVYIATPMDIRRGASLEVFRNTNAGNNVTIDSNPARSAFLPNDRPMRNFVWQSVPLHKSNANSFPQPQIISAISLENSAVSIPNNNNAGSNYISKENESNWPSEIINID